MSDKISLKSVLNEYIDNNKKLEELRKVEKNIKNNQNKRKELILNIIEKKYDNKPIEYEGIKFEKKTEIKTSTLSLKKLETLLKNYFKNDEKAKEVYNYLKEGRDSKENSDLIIKSI